MFVFAEQRNAVGSAVATTVAIVVRSLFAAGDTGTVTFHVRRSIFCAIRVTPARQPLGRVLTGDVVIIARAVAPMVLAQPYRAELLAAGRCGDVPGRRPDTAALRAR